MGEGTKIEWTDETWNPIVGCSITSPGCKGCYAMGMAYRLEAMAMKPDGSGNPALNHYAGTTELTRQGKPVWTGKLGFSESALLKPLRWKKPRRIFVNSMSDLFHEEVLDEWIDKVFAVMALCSQHTFQVLTKRSDRMRKYLTADKVVWRVCKAAARLRYEVTPDPDKRPRQFQKLMSQSAALTAWTYEGGAAHDLWWRKEPERHWPSWINWPFPNIWVGVSIEDRPRLLERALDLKTTPAAVRFWSAEPLLADLGLIVPDLLPDWVIVGGESGPNARPLHPDWARSLRDQCQAAGVPFFFKQWGEWLPVDSGHPDLDGPGFGQFDHCPVNDIGDATHVRVGKKRAGRLLDGREWSEFPA